MAALVSSTDVASAYTIFSYGSNSISQLRARVHNPTLVAAKARLDNFARVFCYASKGWGGGGVASLAPSEGSHVLGAVVQLSEEEKVRLDKYEGSYRLVDLEVSVFEGDSVVVQKAKAYIAGRNLSPPDDCFTPPMTVLPSEEYLTAIYVQLQEQWDMSGRAVTIRSYDTESRAVVPVKEWYHPGIHRLRLEAFCVEINARKKRSDWKMPTIIPRVTAAFVEFLKRVEEDDIGATISTISTVATTLGQHRDALDTLAEIEPELFDDDTLAAIKEALLVAPASSPSESLAFQYDIHVSCPQVTPSGKIAAAELLKRVAALDSWPRLTPEYQDRMKKDAQRILRARKFNIDKSVALASFIVDYFIKESPREISPPDIELEAQTGKTRVGGMDRHNRPVLVLDNTVENTSDAVAQMRFLMFNMELSLRHMVHPVEKHVVFINLENFSLWNAPSLSTTKVTLDILSKYYCERLGHGILWQPPAYFSVFLSACSAFIDPVTYGKVVFIRGEYGEGSDNDKTMRFLLGENWKQITGVDQPKVAEESSPGYDHARYWPNVGKKMTLLA